MGHMRPLTVVDVTSTSTGLTVGVRTPEAAHEVFIRDSQGALGASGDVGLALALLPAMRFGGRLEIKSAVTEGLLAAASNIQDVFLSWDRAGAIRAIGLKRVDVTAASSVVAPARSQNVGCFFSGGVDSFYTLLHRRQEITDLVVVHGFDVKLEDGALRRALSEAAGNVARDLGRRVIEIETDARLLGQRYVTWNHYFGCLLVAVAFSLSSRLGRIYLGTGHTYANLVPDGANPILDAPWSQGSIEVVSDGAALTRAQKVGALADEPLAMEWLRVCWENRNGAYNCGRCEKCLRTKVALQAVGALARCRAMPGPLENGALYGVRVGTLESLWRELALDLELMRADPALTQAVRRVLGPTVLRETHWRWYRVKRALRGQA